ncbi:hypothetical protein PQ469_06015 [Mucilaginibacter sp. KACC 22773]|uniref:hypothetical protein n=1 Tax=Mucilaginibacter sp. KACC 22773 TaxID=3025671 RepID=UPI0023655FE1|nr:hypothetical protein [Mucilaginibacter sp. KACC 22773]WDF79558.1 hypothetical protein PQ469_06015 [Mucilaginibacter sp. KACC 22773]
MSKAIRKKIEDEFTHYNIRLINGGPAMAGRPVNPFDEGHPRHFEFEHFAQKNDLYCSTDCVPGLIEKDLLIKTKFDFYPEGGKWDVSSPFLYVELYKEEETDEEGEIEWYYFVYDLNERPPVRLKVVS